MVEGSRELFCRHFDFELSYEEAGLKLAEEISREVAAFVLLLLLCVLVTCCHVAAQLSLVALLNSFLR